MYVQHFRLSLLLVPAIAAWLVIAPPSQQTYAGLTVNFNLATDQNGGGPVPSPATVNITNAINAAVGIFNDWSNYNKTISVYYNSGVPTADGNFNGTIRFGAGTQYHNSGVAFHEVLHVLGAGTYGAWLNNVDLGAREWTGAAAIELTQQYFPNHVLKADGHIHWVGGGTLQATDMTREGVHILGAIRQDMGLSNGNLYDLPGDFNNNGVVELRDYSAFRANLHSDVSGLTQVEAYRRGDMTLDGQINHADFVAFRAAYEFSQDIGALESALAGVPEPASLILAAMVLAFSGWRCHRRDADG